VGDSARTLRDLAQPTFPKTVWRVHDTSCLRVRPPFLAQLKLNGAFGLPYGFRAGVTYQNIPGIPIYATYVATNAEIAPALGRNLAAGPRGTVSVDLIAPQTRFEDRITQLDVRFSVRFASPADASRDNSISTMRSTPARFCRSTHDTVRRGSRLRKFLPGGCSSSECRSTSEDRQAARRVGHCPDGSFQPESDIAPRAARRHRDGMGAEGDCDRLTSSQWRHISRCAAVRSSFPQQNPAIVALLQETPDRLDIDVAVVVEQYL
jgi:hypothetical protein